MSLTVPSKVSRSVVVTLSVIHRSCVNIFITRQVSSKLGSPELRCKTRKGSLSLITDEGHQKTSRFGSFTEYRTIVFCNGKNFGLYSTIR